MACFTRLSSLRLRSRSVPKWYCLTTVSGRNASGRAAPALAKRCWLYSHAGRRRTVVTVRPLNLTRCQHFLIQRGSACRRTFEMNQPMTSPWPDNDACPVGVSHACTMSGCTNHGSFPGCASTTQRSSRWRLPPRHRSGQRDVYVTFCCQASWRWRVTRQVLKLVARYGILLLSYAPRRRRDDRRPRLVEDADGEHDAASDCVRRADG